MRRGSWFWLLGLALSAIHFFDTPSALAQGQTIQLVNDNVGTVSDDEVYVMFVGNPANVQSNGATVSGLRNLAIPIGNVTTQAAVGATQVVSTTFQNPSFTMPAPPFPLTFVSGASAGNVVKVTGFDPSSGTFTLQAPLAASIAAGVQISVGAYSQKLSSFQKSASTLDSTLSGQTRSIYEVTAVNLDSAVIYISYGQLTYGTSAPVISSAKTAFQTVELTTGVNGGATTSDLTVIDYFSIPIQIQSVNTSDGTATDTRTFYFSKSTIEAGLEAIGGQKLNDVLYLGPGQIAAGSNPPGNPSPFPSFQSYLKSLESEQFVAAGTQSFGAPNPTIVYGIGVQGGYTGVYSFNGIVSEDESGNFAVVLTPQPDGNSFTNKPSYFPDPADVENITINLPKAAKDVQSYDAIIYGALLDADSFTINLTEGAPSLTPVPSPGPFAVTSPTNLNTGTAFQAANLGPADLNYLAPFEITFTTGVNTGQTATVVAIDSAGNLTVDASPALTAGPAIGDTFTVAVSPDDVFTQLYTNSIYSWVVGDVLAGLNFGFPGSPTAGNSTSTWYQQFPQVFPFGVARGSQDDGFYNPWAAFFYNASDAYAFAFNDRIAPSPLMSTAPATQNFRITVLPETQLDAPLVTVTNAQAQSLSLNWPNQTGLKSTTPVTYQVRLEPAVEPSQISITPGTTTTTALITGLSSGTPYTVFVTAHQGAKSSLVLPLYAETTGSVAQVTGTLPVQFNFSWAGTSQEPFPPAAQNKVFINTTSLALSGNPPNSGPNNVLAYGNAGSNAFVLDFQDASTGTSLFKTTYQVDLQGTSSSYTLVDDPVLYGTLPGSVNFSSGQGGNYVPGVPLVINTAYMPDTNRKEFAPVTVPEELDSEEPPSTLEKRQPDMLISRSPSPERYKGKSIYNSSGHKQTITDKVGAGRSRNYYAKLRNDGDESTTFTVRADQGGGNSMEVRYFVGSKEITNKVTSKEGYLIKRLPKNKAEVVRIKVSPSEKANKGHYLRLLLNGKSQGNRSAEDTVKFGIQVR